MNITRIGHGYDIHRFITGRQLILGGLNIEFELGLDGHSDADVLCHAIMDSLLGALALGDIGFHFPVDDESYRDANSLELLKAVGLLMKAHGYNIGNIDSTIVAERPKLAQHIDKMREKLAGALNLETNKISIKATTNENTGLIGKGEGIAAFAVALLYK